jgi:hypothetical protein
VLGRLIERALVRGHVAAGNRNPNALADLVFYGRHPDLRGKKITAGQTALAEEWRSILRDVVQPLLGSAGAGAPSGAAPKPVTTPAPSSTPPGSADPDVAIALRIAKRKVPGMGATTIEQLIEPWRKQICPEVPITILLAFIRFEAGKLFEDATHGTTKNRWTSPPFYELGLFQTPAGQHGHCTGDKWETCEFGPPGREVPADPSQWAKLCAAIKADPKDWTNPTTQVRVGLLDLETSARSLRKGYPDLFPRVGSDWDLRMAVLYVFSRGGGTARRHLTAYRSQLAGLPEDQRWRFLAAKNGFGGDNVEEKMRLATKLGYTPV